MEIENLPLARCQMSWTGAQHSIDTYKITTITTKASLEFPGSIRFIAKYLTNAFWYTALLEFHSRWSDFAFAFAWQAGGAE